MELTVVQNMHVMSVGFQYNKHSFSYFDESWFVLFIIFSDNLYQSQTGLFAMHGIHLKSMK